MGNYPRAYFAKKVDKDASAADVKADGPVKVSKKVPVKKAASEGAPSEEKTTKVKRVSKKAAASK